MHTREWHDCNNMERNLSEKMLIRQHKGPWIMSRHQVSRQVAQLEALIEAYVLLTTKETNDG